MCPFPTEPCRIDVKCATLCTSHLSFSAKLTILLRDESTASGGTVRPCSQRHKNERTFNLKLFAVDVLMLRQILHIGLLGWHQEHDRIAFATAARTPSGAMYEPPEVHKFISTNVTINTRALSRHIELHHPVDIGDIDAARHQISGEQDSVRVRINFALCGLCTLCFRRTCA